MRQIVLKVLQKHTIGSTKPLPARYICSLYITALRLLLFILLFLCGVDVFGQVFKGKVTEVTNGQPLFPVTVVNIRTQQATYTNEQGYFSIEAEKGDRVAFSYVGYKNLEHTVNGEENTSIRMVRVSYQLKEFIIMPDFTQYQIDSIERARTYRPFLTRTRSSPIASPVSFVAEKLNKRSKQIFKFQKKFGQWEDERFIDSRYTPELVNEMTGLVDDSLAHFMNAHPMPYDYARAATELEMKMWIRTHYREWIKTIDSTGLPVINDDLLKKP